MNEDNFMHTAQAEYNIASSELSKFSPQEFYRRHDALIKNTINSISTKPACRAGCSYCCYYKVEARALEVLAIQQYVVSKFEPEKIRQVKEQASRNVNEAKGLSYKEHLATNQQCPFLIENQCSVYAVRPSKCRNFHAADVQGCKESYEQPENLTIPNAFIEEVFETGNGATMGFEKATDVAGFDPRFYDLNSAFLEAMDTKFAKRMKSGKKAFLSATIVNVPDETTF
jgi:Fe-S-cluster containining protein